MNKKPLIFFITFLFLTGICHLRSEICLSQTFDSENFHIDFGNFNMTSGSKTSTNYRLTDTVGQIAPGQFDSNGYTVKAGFQYIYETNIPFSFEITNLDLSFGYLTPNTPSTVFNTLIISTPSGNGYDILAIANHPLTTIGASTTIPDTKCDSGTCSQSSHDLWVNNSTYGFGFNAFGDGTSSYFPSTNHFRQFADNSLNETAQIIMSENNRVEDHSALITYKVNISPQQSAGTYQNSINFIAVPKY